MAGSVYRVTCSVCGASFVPPHGASTFFCPQCGMKMAQVPSPLTPEQAQDQAALAVEQAARAAEQAMKAAKLAQNAKDRMQAMEIARQATLEAAEAMRMAQESHKVQERQLQENQALLACQNEEFEQRTREYERRKAEAEAAEAAAAEAHKKVVLEAMRRAEQKRVAEEQSRAKEEAGKAAAQPQPQAAPQSQSTQQTQAAPQPQPAADSAATEYRRNVTVRHTDGRGLYIVTIPTNWMVSDTSINRQATRRFNPWVKFVDGEGAEINLRQGDAGTRLSSGMKALMNTYGSAIAAVDRTNYADMPNPINLADTYVLDLTKRVGATDVHFVREIPNPDLEARRQHAKRKFEEAARMQGSAIIKDPFVGEILRVYNCTINGVVTNIAVYVRLYAVKDGSGVENMSPVGLMFNAGSALGGLFGRKRQAQQQQQQPMAQAGGTAWCIPAFDSYKQGGTIYWDVCGFATLTAPASDFEQKLKTAFIPLVDGYDVHSDMVNLAMAETQQETAQIQAATNRQINAMNMQAQASMRYAQQMSAASSAQVDAYLRQSDAHHQAFRQRTNAQFNTGYGGTSAPDYSEAIRGVNTFVTSDGREVELDVSADRAYENQAGDVIGGSGGFDPGYDWTEIPRA